MQEYITELSKYIIAICMAWYTLECFLAIRTKQNKHKNRSFARQELIIFLVQFFCFLSLTIENQNIKYIFFYAFVQVFLASTIFFVRMIYDKINCLFLNNMCMLLGVGFVILSRFSLDKAIRQLAVALVALLVGLLVPVLMNKITFLRKLSWLYAAIGIGVLFCVLTLGEITYGSKLSFTIAEFTFQPSEFIKLVFVFFLAAALYENCTFKRIAITTVLAAVHVMILVFSRDLGSALIFFVAYLFVVFIASGKYLYLVLGTLAGGVGAVCAYYLFDHVRIRVLAWQDPFSYIDNQGFQITQSLFAIASGGWFGLGLGEGVPEDIPFVETDFIFSALCEEMGVICGVCILLICISSFLAMMKMGLNLKDNFYRLIASGLGVMYLFQIFLTIGGGIKFIPLTGVTLPFVSYGGSSIAATILLFFVIMAVGMRKQTGVKEKTEKREKHALYVTYGFVILFLIMIGYLVYFTATSKQELMNNSYNSRQELLLLENYRGTIYSSDGEILAQTDITQEGTEERTYPYAELFAHIVGFSTNGKSGIEAQANYYLINSNIPFPNKVANEHSGKKNPGDNVYTSLDVDIQQAAYKALGDYTGAIIVSDPNTGQILAMVSKPDFDPNEIVTIWDDVVSDTDSSVLLNRASQGLYPPGSTFKMITALQYIRENPDAWNNFEFDCPGYYTEGGSRINCYHGIDHGEEDFTASFAKSCNAAFSNIGLQLNVTQFAGTLEKLRFNQTLPVGFNYAKSSALISENISTAEMMQTAIGQGKTQITPLHLNMITAAIANDGMMMKPYVIEHVETTDGNVIKTFSPSECGEVLTAEEAEILTNLMMAVVEDGTATSLSELDYTVAGKTGSAEYNDVKGESHAWFTGFAPADNPQICVTVIVEGAGSGSDYAVPVAKCVFNAYFNK